MRNFLIILSILLLTIVFSNFLVSADRNPEEVKELLADMQSQIDELKQQLQNAQGGPRLAYDSGWVFVSSGDSITLHHNVGGNPDRYIVLLDIRDADTEKPHNWGHGFMFIGSFFAGTFFTNLGNESIDVVRGDDSGEFDVRVRIITY
jgi:hypothetical protein